jgi:hypothetical protein
LQEEYIKTIDFGNSFSREKSNLGTQICQKIICSEASRFAQLEEPDWAWKYGKQDKGNIWRPCVPRRHPDFIVECVMTNLVS